MKRSLGTPVPIILALLTVLALTFAAYASGLGGPLVFDDLQALASLDQWQSGQIGWQSVVLGNNAGWTGRPLSMASFVLDVALLGPGTWNHKLSNVLLHLVNGVLVFALFREFVRKEAKEGGAPQFLRWLPLLGAAIWLLHPLLVSTVLYVVQRMAMLSAFFTLLAMLAYLRGRRALVAGDFRRAVLWLATLCPTLLILATLSKENGLLAPALCAVIELFLFVPKVGVRRRWPSTAFIAVALALPALIAAALTVASHDLVVAGYANRPFTLGERLLTQPRVLWEYVVSLLLPYGPRMGLYHDDFIVSRTLWQPATTMLAPVAWALLIAAAWWKRRSVPGFGLGLGIFLVGHALESSVFPLLMYFEHRNYLPAIGVIWMVLSLARVFAPSLSRKMEHPTVIFRAFGIAMVLTLALATASRAGIWSSQDLLLDQGLRYHPDSRWLRTDLFGRELRQGPEHLSTAREHADHLGRSADASTRRLGAILSVFADCSMQQTVSADALERAFEGNPDPMEADILASFEALAAGVAQSGCPGFSPDHMAARLSEMLTRSRLPAHHKTIWRLRLSAAKLYIAGGKGDAALDQAQAALAGSDGDPAAAVLMAGLLLQRGDLDGASAALTIAERKAAESDFAGRAVIDTYRAQILRSRPRKGS